MKIALGHVLMAAILLVNVRAATAESAGWDRKAAAAYLDQRAAWWMEWKSASRDHETFCISCHTALPYALARPLLRGALNERIPSPNELRFLDNVTKRVRLWNDVEPFYSDKSSGAPKTLESRGTEAILNALILASAKRDDARTALNNMWALQEKSGELRGSFPWLNFKNEPWEADDSRFFGSALAAIAVGAASDGYRATPAIQDNLKSLADYLERAGVKESTINRAFALWAASKVPGILKSEERKSIVSEILSKQQADGGWSMSSVIVAGWRHKDATPMESGSDGYATGLLSFVLQQAGVSQNNPQLKRGLVWLAQNQNKTDGSWPALSLNKKRDPASDPARFMSDAATAYAVLALTRH